MILALFADDIRAIFFLALRLIAAVGGFFVGYFLSEPLIALLVWLTTRKSLPRWLMVWLKLAAGLGVALLVFWYLPLGGGGGGGGGSGGGTGKGIGPGKGDSGGVETIASASKSGQKSSDVPGERAGPAPDATEILSVQLLGGEAVKEGRYYLIAGKPPAVDASSLAQQIDAMHAKLAGIDVVLTDQSVGESHQAVRLLVQMAQERKLRSRILTPGQNK